MPVPDSGPSKTAVATGDSLASAVSPDREQFKPLSPERDRQLRDSGLVTEEIDQLVASGLPNLTGTEPNNRDLNTLCQDAQRLASDTSSSVAFSFNGALVVATPDSKATTLIIETRLKLSSPSDPDHDFLTSTAARMGIRSDRLNYQFTSELQEQEKFDFQNRLVQGLPHTTQKLLESAPGYYTAIPKDRSALVLSYAAAQEMLKLGVNQDRWRGLNDKDDVKSCLSALSNSVDVDFRGSLLKRHVSEKFAALFERLVETAGTEPKQLIKDLGTIAFRILANQPE